MQHKPRALRNDQLQLAKQHIPVKHMPTKQHTKITTRKSATAQKISARGVKRKWSAEVSKRSNAMDLEPGVFTSGSARSIALSLKKSAEASHRRKAQPFQSAMSMLNFEINRGGKGLSPARRRVLDQAKSELRKVFHRPAS